MYTTATSYNQYRLECELKIIIIFYSISQHVTDNTSITELGDKGLTNKYLHSVTL